MDLHTNLIIIIEEKMLRLKTYEMCLYIVTFQDTYNTT